MGKRLGATALGRLHCNREEQDDLAPSPLGRPTSRINSARISARAASECRLHDVEALTQRTRAFCRGNMAKRKLTMAHVLISYNQH